MLALTEEISAAAETPSTNDSRAQLLEALTLLRTFIANDQERNPTAPLTLTSGHIRHRPSSDTGTDIIGWHFKENSLGNCVVIVPDTYLDDSNILWHTLQVFCSTARYALLRPTSQARLTSLSTDSTRHPTRAATPS